MTEREEFEAWATTLDLDLTAIAGGHYSDCNTDFAWLAWSAARRTTPDREAIIAALREIAEQDPIEMALDPTWAKRIAAEAFKTATNGEKK